MQDLLESVKDYFDTFSQLFDKLPKQIIHRDPTPGNIILSKNNGCGFIDFDLSEKIFVYLTLVMLSFSLESFDENDSIKLSKWIEIYLNIIYGYDSIVKLTNVEKKAIPYVMFTN